MLAVPIVLVLTLAQSAVPGIPAPGAGLDSKGTAAISGRVTAADSGRPLRRARITVSGGALTAPRSTSTNIRGEFELKNLPAGRYLVRAERNGYLALYQGQRHSRESPSPMQVADGQTIDKLDFALPRAGIIAGRVIDETGEAVSGVHVRALRQQFYNGRRRLVPAASQATTDDIGQYRLLNVPPGEYVVMAMLRETWNVGAERRPYGYSPTFFPGTPRAVDAQRVKVGVGEEVANNDFALIAQPAGTISGTATGVDGRPLAGARVSLSFQIVGPGSSMRMSIGSAVVAADGSWRIKDVPPGEYELDVSSQEPAHAYMTVQVQGDVEGIALAADYGGTITGQIVTDNGERFPPFLDVSTDVVGPAQRAFGRRQLDEGGTVGEDGRFTVTGVLGPAAIRVANLPRGWAIKSIHGAQHDLSDTPIQLRGGQTLDVRIVITKAFPDVTGRIIDDRANPVDGSVLLFPSAPERWYDTNVLRMARPDQTGMFRVETVRPGDYLAIALDYVESSQANDPEFLEEMRSRATRVTVLEGQPQTLTLKVVR